MPVDPEELKCWVQKADRDRRMAELALAESPPITDGAAFHVQQAVEKLLKAYLVWRDHEFEKIHDLRALANNCATYDQTFLDLRDRVAPLTPFAVRFRYPSSADPTVDHVRQALAVVDEVREFVLARLPTELRP